MISETLQILKEQLEIYFENSGYNRNIIIGNIAMQDSNSESDFELGENVVMTLLKLDEELTLKNIPNYKVINGVTEYRNTPVHLNLYVLISSLFKDYNKSLKYLSKVIQFFQGKNSFTSTNTAYNRENPEMDLLSPFKFNLELYTPTFEELNYIWSTHGGKQLPSVIYKIQLVEIDKSKKAYTAPVITQIDQESHKV